MQDATRWGAPTQSQDVRPPDVCRSRTPIAQSERVDERRACAASLETLRISWLCVGDSNSFRTFDLTDGRRQTAVQRTGACQTLDRAPDPACAACRQRASGQRSGRRLMRPKRCAPISCRHRCRRKEPLHSDHRSGRGERRRSASLFRAGRDNFRDNRGGSRRARKSRSRLYLAFSPR